jgi:hypothetical protein
LELQAYPSVRVNSRPFVVFRRIWLWLFGGALGSYINLVNKSYEMIDRANFATYVLCVVEQIRPSIQYPPASLAYVVKEKNQLSHSALFPRFRRQRC